MKRQSILPLGERESVMLSAKMPQYIFSGYGLDSETRQDFVTLWHSAVSITDVLV